MVSSEWRIGKKLFQSLFAIRNFPFATVTRYSPTYVTGFLDVGLSIHVLTAWAQEYRALPRSDCALSTGSTACDACPESRVRNARPALRAAAARLSRTCLSGTT